MKDQFLIYNETKEYFSPCYSCQAASHFFENCPVIHYFPNKLIHISRLTFTANQTRNGEFRRLRIKTRNVLNNLIKIKKHAFRARFDKKLMAYFTMNSSAPSLTKDEDDFKTETNYEAKSQPYLGFKRETPIVFHSLRDLRNLEENNLNFSLKRETSIFCANTKNSGSSGSKSMFNEANSRSQKIKQFLIFIILFFVLLIISSLNIVLNFFL